MRRIRQMACLLAVSLLAQPAVADTPSENTQTPFGQLQAQLDALEERTQVLEDGAPTVNVEGRTYCSMLQLDIARARSFNATEELQTNIIRRKATFSGGAFSGAYISNVLNNQTDDGVVEHEDGEIIDPLLATYVQTGSKLDITFAAGPTATWYVSKDGSLIHGTKIEHGTFAGGLVTIGFVRSWTLIETDPLDICDGEDL